MVQNTFHAGEGTTLEKEHASNKSIIKKKSTTANTYGVGRCRIRHSAPISRPFPVQRMTEISKPRRPIRYWRSNSRLIGILLASWGLVTFVPVYFASALSGFVFFGWPFPFWVAAFGAPIAFLLIVGVYAWRMEKLDERRRAQKVAQT